MDSRVMKFGCHWMSQETGSRGSKSALALGSYKGEFCLVFVESPRSIMPRGGFGEWD